MLLDEGTKALRFFRILVNVVATIHIGVVVMPGAMTNESSRRATRQFIWPVLP